MAANNKDPAFLFYPSDFLTGTMLMSDEQVGKYTRLLCLQHQQGHLSEKHMLQICKTYDEDIYSKFTQDENGLYYNKRLDNEATKRREYSESRRKNRNSKKEKGDIKNICQTYVTTYEEHMENENININKDVIKKDIYGSFKNVKLTDKEVEKLKEQFHDYKDRIENISIYMKSKGDKYKSHYATILNWARNEEPKAKPTITRREL